MPDTLMRDVLQRWVVNATQAGPPPAPGTLAADVLAIRDALFQPLGTAALEDVSPPPSDVMPASTFTFPKQLPAFLTALASLDVQLANGEVARVDVSRQPRGFSNVIFIPYDDGALLKRLLLHLGPGGFGKTSPVGAWWNTFFQLHQGNWGNLGALTYPTFSSIEFLDTARTRALVSITIDDAAATAVLEKIDGVWTLTRVADPRWA